MNISFKKQVSVRLTNIRGPKKSLGVLVLRMLLWPLYAVGLAVLTVVAAMLWLVETVCHAIGLAVLFPPKAVVRLVRYTWRTFASDVLQTIEFVPERVRRIRDPQFAHSLILFAGIAVAGFGLLQVGNLLAEGLQVKGNILGQATSALARFEEGKNKIVEENLEEAQNKFTASVDEFRAGEAALAQSNVVLQALVRVLPLGRDAESLLKAGENGSQAAVHLTRLFQDLKMFTFDGNGLRSESGITLAQAKEEFEKARTFIALASTQARSVNVAHIPQAHQEQFQKLQGQLVSLESSMRTMGQVFDVLEVLTTGDTHVLVLLQNSNELRPTGGFLGTFGAFDLHDGAITSQTISSIYDLDGQLQKKYTPPLPLFAVNNRWFLRDSNWFASFPDSAETILGFYEEETNKKADMVIALTPELAVRLLELTGPIQLPAYGISLDADNFIEVTQVETSIHYDKKENKPKKMLSDFFPIFLSRIASLSHDRFPELLKALEQSVAAKDIQMYARDEQLQQTFRSLAWDGSIRENSRDYISIVSANLGGTKTDLSIEQQVSLASKVDADGWVVNTLRINRSNPLPRVEGLENKTFMRVYVPLGSQLLSSKGFTYVNLGVQHDAKNDVHPAVAHWEKQAVTEVGSGMLVGEESGKTYFGNWISLAGGQRQTMELVYKLPFRLEVLDRYSVLIQKQPGATAYPLKYELNFPSRNLLWATEETPVGFEIAKELDISRDRFYGVVLQQEK